MTKAIETGLPQLRIEESAARTQARIDSGQQIVVGVNRYRSDAAEHVDVLKVDNAAVRAEQIGKLAKLKQERNSGAVDAALDTLSRAARGRENLLAAAVDAARAGATLGEMSAALERVFGRHLAEVRAPSGVYAREIGTADPSIRRVLAMTAEFERNEGRRPAILVAKVGQDGHDRGQKVIASAFTDFGFDVKTGALFATPEQVASHAVAKNVHIVGVSTLAAGHLSHIPALRFALEALGRADILIAVGGVVPPQDYEALKSAGVAEIFPPGTVAADAAEKLLEELNRRLGYAQRSAAE
jgi:methylmalonyl-CoA mutase